MSEWKDWFGGSQPAANDVEVEVKFREGGVNIGLAEYFQWSHGGNLRMMGEIVSYRFTGRVGPQSALDTQPHSHYFKDVRHLDYIDIYRVIDLFEQECPVLGHIAKKALCAGDRGHKDLRRDVQDMLDSAKRKLAMMDEDARKLNQGE